MGLDKFYTKKHVAERCLDIVGNKYPWDRWSLVVEPSAGNGSFFDIIPSDKKLGIDIEPEHPDIRRQDLFTYYPEETNKDILVIGNPPFGRVSSMAVKFFNHCGKWASVIAFIVPRTFRRISIQNKLNLKYHLVYDEDIDISPCAFYPKMMVKCCFQIWERKEQSRNIIELTLDCKDWDFLPFGPKDNNNQPTPPKGADFALRAYGSNCGQIVEIGLEKLRPKSWHWIKSNIDKRLLINRFLSLDYSVSLDTARQNSLGKKELVNLYTTYNSDS